MNHKTRFRALYGSPRKALFILALLTAAAFMFLYSLTEYCISNQEYKKTEEKYEGVLTVEWEAVRDNLADLDFFLLTDETGRTSSYGTELFDDLELTYEDNHQRSLEEDLIGKLSALPYVSRMERRYLTAGVSSEYYRLDTDKHFFPYDARCIITALVQYRYTSNLMYEGGLTKEKFPQIENIEYLTLQDVELLAGDPNWLCNVLSNQIYDQHTLRLTTFKEEYRNEKGFWDCTWDWSNRWSMVNMDNLVYTGDTDMLQPGRRYLFVLRNNIEQSITPLQEFKDVYPTGFFHTFDVGDDSLIGWWPYFTDITDLPEDWITGGDFTDLRELIQITNDDVHTFDMVYCDDMAAQRRVSESRMICEEGRFITPDDAGQPVCVVNVEFLNTYGLKVGDTITLDLGNYLSEQYAPLGAVAVTRGRQSTRYTTQTFTIIGAWHDLNEGNHGFQDRFWCWSNNAIFVPTAFLPECRNAEGHEFKPSEVSFVVGNAEDISAFVKECLPRVEALGLRYQFSDGGWLLIEANLSATRKAALRKLIAFSIAAMFALVLTVWLSFGQKEQKYGISHDSDASQRNATNHILVPFLLIGLVSALLGMSAARFVTLRQLVGETAHALAETKVILMGTLGYLVMLVVLALLGLISVHRRISFEFGQRG